MSKHGRHSPHLGSSSSSSSGSSSSSSLGPGLGSGPQASILHRRPAGAIRTQVAVVDNYDSFTFNLVQYLQMLGAEVWVVEAGISSLAPLRSIPAQFWIVSPGPGRPEDAGIGPELWAAALAGRTPPVLGVCLGHQGLCLAAGARVERAARVMHGKSSRVSHRGEGIFRGLPDPLKVARYHSLTVNSSSLPEALRLDAWVQPEACHPEVMAVSHRDLPLYGLQFHPESIATPQGMTLIANFLGLPEGEAASVVAKTARAKPHPVDAGGQTQGPPLRGDGSLRASPEAGSDGVEPGGTWVADGRVGSWWNE